LNVKERSNGELINSIQFINYGGFEYVNDQVLKIDKIELKFKDRDERIQSIEEFSKQFERGILFFEHPETVNDSVIIMDIASNYGAHSCHFKFDRMDIDMGHYLIDELVRKWSLIWTWYNQAHFDSNKELRKYPSIFEMVKSRFGEASQEYEALLNLSPEEVQMYMDAGEVDEIDDIHKNMDWMIEFDNKNSFEKMRREKIYFEHDFQVWVDLNHSLPAIREIILELEGTEN